MITSSFAAELWGLREGFLLCSNLNISSLLVELEHSHQLSQKKCHFDTLKTHFIILEHHFTTYHLSDVLYFNSIH